MKIWRHLKSVRLIVSPPARKARQLPGASVAIVYETSGNATWTTVQVLVTAPHGEVRAPVVQPKRHVSGRVGEITTDDASFALPCLSDPFDVEPLTVRIINSAEQDQRNRRTFAPDHLDNVLVAHATFAVARREFKK